ncbi:HEPN domain-containing protein [Pontibacter sp. BT327]|uniref:HEPN domain-containing protein n=1 Tax=Pontibacter burrus TaxID=2704466 RepID=A0A6B3M1I5_9BACT|nr:HEPN domain-containing protein [Pontibacter burrus]
MLHQAAEFAYRAILLSLTRKEVRTHSIKALIRHSRRYATGHCFSAQHA